jgi:hypothetical protein
MLRRYWRGGQLSFMKLTRVVADDDQGLRLWMPAGSPYWRFVAPDGRTHHDAPIDQLQGGRLIRQNWTGSDVLIWMPAAQPYSVWWFWVDGAFDRWYVNLEEPYVRWADRGCAGVDTADQAFDLVVAADRTWRRKDEEEFIARTGQPLYWSADQAARIRATGERLASLVEAGAFPFDGTWCGFRPDASWTVPPLPVGHDRPRARSASSSPTADTAGAIRVPPPRSGRMAG